MHAAAVLGKISNDKLSSILGKSNIYNASISLVFEWAWPKNMSCIYAQHCGSFGLFPAH